MKLGPDNAPC